MCFKSGAFAPVLQPPAEGSFHTLATVFSFGFLAKKFRLISRFSGFATIVVSLLAAFYVDAGHADTHVRSKGELSHSVDSAVVFPSVRTTVDGWQIISSEPLSYETPSRSSRFSNGKNGAHPRYSTQVGNWGATQGVPTGGGAGADGWFQTSRQSGNDDLSTHEAVSPLTVTTETSVPTSVGGIESEIANGAALTHPINESNGGVVIEMKQEPSERSVLSSIKVNSQNLDLFLGEVNVISEVDVSRVAIGNGNIVRAEVLDGGELLIIATAAGSTSIRLWNNDNTQSDYNVRVSETDPQTRVHMQPIVRMRVRMVEFRKSALGRLGIDWGDSVSGPSLAATAATVSNNFNSVAAGIDASAATTAPFSTFFGIASNITSSINFLAQNGDAVTLAEPVLSAMNGSTASFLAGGEVPYPVVGDNGQTQIEFKEYGVKLNVAPLIDAIGNVHAIVETEISQLDTSVSINGTPGLLTRRAQTEVTVSSGETIVISGLLSSESSTDADMLPGLGNLPIIGRFFSSRSRNNSASELVIFVTPEVIDPGERVINHREQQYFTQSNERLINARQQLPLME